MKKTNIVNRLALAAVALALTLGACQKEENTSDTPGGELKTLRIEVENQGTGGSKMETEGLQVYWNAGDRVGIYYADCPITFSGGNACVNVPTQPAIFALFSKLPDNWRGRPRTFNAYYPPSIAAYDEEFTSGTSYRYNTINYGTGNLSITLPARYESSFAGGRQQIQLPMIGTYYFCADAERRDARETTYSFGREVLRFQHLTAALLVKVRNDSGQPLLVDRVAVSSGYYKISGSTVAEFFNTTKSMTPDVNANYEQWANYAASFYRAFDVSPCAAEAEAEKQVEVVFPEPVVVAPGEILPVQVPILPMGPFGVYESTNVTDNLTIRVEGRNENAPGTIDGRRLTFQHTVEITQSIRRNEMKTIQIKMDPASPRVTVSAGGAFSVNAGNHVYFSQGNLQYDKATSTWSFMEHQWSTVETNSQNVGADYAAQDIVSLFGWGTSGHNYGPANYQPWSTSAEGSDYGPVSSVLSPTGQSDWGCNAIANGGNTASSGWFTLSRAQWEYLLGDTPERVGRWTLATVNNVPGLLLLPDDQPPFSSPDLTQYTTYTYTLDTWQDMEALGAVFLPAAGMRTGTSVTRVPESAPSTYWTSDPVSDGQTAYALFMVPGDVFLHQDVRERGSAVRLVRYAQ